ncbi:MAG: NADH-quinone oxidoreductase subunit L, partial [Pseudomonadota bacterium]
YFYDFMVGHSHSDFWGAAIYTATENTVLKDKYDVPHWVFWAPLIVTIGGFVMATLTYFFNRGFGKKIAESGGPLHSLFSNKWYFDEIYEATVVRATRGLGDLFWKVGDKAMIDGLGPDGVTKLTRWGSRRISAMHTGYLYHYAFTIIAAALILGGVFYFRSGGAG